MATRPTEMSMSITCEGCGLSYKGGTGAPGIFAQRRRALDPRFWKLLLAVRRFQKEATDLLETGADTSLTYGQFLADRGFDQHFVTHYALPVVSCVWSMGHHEALDYPAAYLFADIEHRSFIPFPFTNDHNAVHVHCIKGFSHGVHGGLISRLFISTSHQTAAGNRCRFGDAYKF